MAAYLFKASPVRGIPKVSRMALSSMPDVEALMTQHTYHEEKLLKINSLQKRISKGWIKLFSLVALVTVLFIAILAGIVVSMGLSATSALLMAAIWIVPLFFIIRSRQNQIDTDSSV